MKIGNNYAGDRWAEISVGKVCLYRNPDPRKPFEVLVKINRIGIFSSTFWVTSIRVVSGDTQEASLQCAGSFLADPKDIYDYTT